MTLLTSWWVARVVRVGISSHTFPGVEAIPPGNRSGSRESPCYTLCNMDVTQLSANAQDYLKVIWDLQEWDDGPVQPTAVAERTGMKQSTVSGALSRLVDAGLVEHKPYRKVGLTPAGRRSAVTMVRRHRLLETFLVEVLDYSWDEVHEEADALEHAVSDKMIEKIDRYLGHPTQDPHGDAIPTETGTIPDIPKTKPLSQVETGRTVRVQRVSDEDSGMLRYLSDHGIGPGSLLQVVSKRGEEEPVILRLVAGSGERPDQAARDGGDDLRLEFAQAALIQVGSPGTGRV